MPAKTPAKSAIAKKRARNELGYFIPAVQIDGSSKPKKDQTASDNLVEIKVKNPLHKIAQILQDIKSHQSTSFNIHFSIPLIALPIFLLALFSVFQLGRAQVGCVPTFISKIGVIKSLSVKAPKQDQNVWTILFGSLPVLPSLLPQNQLVTKEKILLVPTNGEPVNVISQESIHITPFEGQKVVVSGNFSECTNTITLDDPKNLTTMQ